MTTPQLLLRCLREGIDEVRVPPEVAARARRAVAAMVAVGEPGAGE
jgi:quinolinate synthase